MSFPADCYTLAELAPKYRTSVKVLRADIGAGKLRALKTGRSWVVKPSDLPDWEATREAHVKGKKPKRRHPSNVSETAIKLFGV